MLHPVPSLCTKKVIRYAMLKQRAPICRQNAWRPMLARIQLLSKLVPILGVQSGSGEGIPLDGLVKLLGSCLGGANAEVRSAAVDLTVLVSMNTRSENKGHRLATYSCKFM